MGESVLCSGERTVRCHLCLAANRGAFGGAGHSDTLWRASGQRRAHLDQSASGAGAQSRAGALEERAVSRYPCRAFVLRGVPFRFRRFLPGARRGLYRVPPHQAAVATAAQHPNLGGRFGAAVRQLSPHGALPLPLADDGWPQSTGARRSDDTLSASCRCRLPVARQTCANLLESAGFRGGFGGQRVRRPPSIPLELPRYARFLPHSQQPTVPQSLPKMFPACSAPCSAPLNANLSLSA